MNPSETHSKEILSATSTVLFGKKHRGKTVADILKEDPGYITWVLENSNSVTFSPEVIAMASDSQIPVFKFSLPELFEHLQVISQLEKGLDSYGNAGIRQLHGFNDKDNIHKSLSYVRRMMTYIKEELATKQKLFIKL